ncbi:hypothetical protein [Mesorhizobium sp.]|uniref:hypothetical protein n=1 Tax=Mesorhizobium sp. TaxID=1871066 RepID=UPI0025BD9C1F|nr:hypothetical protein [Mesorhizobium sp.]
MIALGSRLADPEAVFAAAGLAVFAVAALAADLGFVFFAAAAGFTVVFGLEPAFAGDGVLAGEAVLEDEAKAAPASTGAALAVAFAGGVVFAAFATKSLPGVLVLLLRRISFRFRKRSSAAADCGFQEIRPGVYVLPLSAAVQVLPQRQRRKDLPPKSCPSTPPAGVSPRGLGIAGRSFLFHFGRGSINKKMRLLTLA